MIHCTLKLNLLRLASLQEFELKLSGTKPSKDSGHSLSPEPVKGRLNTEYHAWRNSSEDRTPCCGEESL
jgi:hypothetical protein